ncbi:hydrolase [Erwinia tracheiphila PSU-1]|nr:hydrolase [Erwinia tracheiphila PSU-1]
MLAVIDLVVAGFHEPLFAPQDKATNTAAMIAAMASANMNIISYPDNPKLF